MTCVLPRIPRLLLVSGVLALAVALLAMACGGEAEAPSGGETPSDGAQSITLDISQGDNFFEPNDFVVSPGQTVTFNITNDGQAIHNMRIAGPDGEYDTDDDAVSDPDIVNPGETAVVTWTAPDEPGDIVFRCDFHFPEQTGSITVQ
jgi:plastocyanin